MSADNGVYILVTPCPDGFEYRVRHLQAVENMSWGRCPIHGSDFHYGNDSREACAQCRQNAKYTDDENIIIENAREMWKGATVYTSKGNALAAAAELYEKLYICEYGICIIRVNRQF